MKQLSLIVSGLLAIVFTACTNEEICQETQEPTAGQLITVKAYTAGENVPDSRIAQTWEDNVMKLSWSNNDQFSVIRGGENSTFSKSTEENDFTGVLPTAGEGNYYAAYPVTTATGHTAVSFDISNQNEGMPYLMYAASGDGESYQFQHAVAYLKATFPEELQGKTATITLTLPTGVYANGNINLTSGSLSEGSEQSITKNVTFSNESTEVLLAIPPMTANNKTLRFLVVEGTNNYVATLTGSDDTAIAAGNYYSAKITLESASLCNLPEGDYYNNPFKIAIKNFLSNTTTNNLTKIKFIANSDKSTGTQIQSSGAYLIANEETSTLEIHTAADVFVFPAKSDGMFYANSVDDKLGTITSIDFNNCINTAGVTNMYYMFRGCVALTELDLSSFNTDAVTNMERMFQNCEALTELDLSNFNTAKVTNMNYMFCDCEALTELDLSNFNTKMVTRMDNMFYNCKALTKLDLSNFNTEKVTIMEYMFNNCVALTELDLSSFTFNKGNYQFMFKNTGKDATNKPISIYVKNEADQTTLENGNTKIDSDYAKIVVKTNE